MGADGLACSFCGLVRKGGVAGPTTEVYICRDCIQLASLLIDSGQSHSNEAGATGGDPHPAG
jgi:hypothetical protein